MSRKIGKNKKNPIQKVLVSIDNYLYNTNYLNQTDAKHLNKLP